MTLAWSVSSDTQPDAFDTYRESLADVYDVRDVANGGSAGFTSLTRMIRFGPSVLARARSVGQTFVRDARLARRSGLDHVSIIVDLSDGAGDFDGKSAKSGSGSVQFRDLARPSASIAGTVDLVNLVVPRHILPSWLLRRCFHGFTLAGRTAGARLIASHLRTLAEVAGEMTEEEGIAAVEATFVIAERFVGHRQTIAPLHSEAIQRTIRRRAMQLFDSASLPRSASVADVAEAIGISRSGLYRAFEPMGGVIAYVRHRRLDRVYATLRAPAGKPYSIDELAWRHGFTDGSQLARAFHKRFGCRPHEIRPSVLEDRNGSGINVHGEIDRAAHDVAIDWLRVGELV